MFKPVSNYCGATVISFNLWLRLSFSPVVSLALAVLVIDLTEQFVLPALKVVLVEIGVGGSADHLVLLTEGREEATDSTAFPAGVGHEERVLVTEAITGPLRTARVLINTALHRSDRIITVVSVYLLIRPATGFHAGRSHEVKQISAA